MNLKNLILALTSFVIASTFVATTSFAVDVWSICTPVTIGPAGNVVRLKVTGCNVAPQTTMADKQGNPWLSLSGTGTDQQMASILTAMSLGNKPISIKTTGTTDAEGYGVAEAILFTNN